MIHSTLGNSKDMTAANLAAQVAADIAAPAATPTRATLAAPDMSAMSPAYRIGFWDGLQQEPCCPEMYFAAPSRIASYMLGFLTAQPGNLIALTRWQDFLDADAADRRDAADHYQFVQGLGR